MLPDGAMEAALPVAKYIFIFDDAEK